MFKTKALLFGALTIFAVLVLSSFASAYYNPNPYYESTSYTKSQAKGYVYGPAVSKTTRYDRDTFYDHDYWGYGKTTIYKKQERVNYLPVQYYAPRYWPEFHYYQQNTAYGYFPYQHDGYSFNNGYCYGGCGNW